MTPEDAEIIRNIRREIGKRPIDASRMDIQSVKGRVTLAGIVGATRESTDTNVQHELDMLAKLLMRDRLVKEVSLAARIVQPDKEDKEHEDGGRGRMRNPH